MLLIVLLVLLLVFTGVGTVFIGHIGLLGLFLVGVVLYLIVHDGPRV